MTHKFINFVNNKLDLFSTMSAPNNAIGEFHQSGPTLGPSLEYSSGTIQGRDVFTNLLGFECDVQKQRGREK